MATRRMTSKYVLCIDNEEYPASLERRKVYRLVSDKLALEKKLLRVVDESGEDYLYPERLFVPVDLPSKARSLFSRSA